jgi:hypothetical protein
MSVTPEAAASSPVDPAILLFVENSGLFHEF